MSKIKLRLDVKVVLLFLSATSFCIYSGCRTLRTSGLKTDLNRTWSMYKADAESSGYSVLDEINKDNVAQLSLAWKHAFSDAPEGAGPISSESNPIIVDNVMYTLSARHRVYALDASTGQEIWTFDPFNGGTGGGVGRGVTYWEEGTDKRILLTAGDRLFALNAQTGVPIATFGEGGKVNLNVGMRGNPDKISVIPTTPGIIYEDLLILGTEVSELYGAEPGYVRAYNIRTGKLEWTFKTIPGPGEIGYDTWPKDAWKYVGGANNWGGMSLDAKRGMVFLATGSPTYDYYGADRTGKNYFGNSVVALDARTGTYKWHFQTIHHDLWDYDLPAPPNLITVVHDGKKIDAVAQTSKVGFLYVFNRETGVPLFPIEERPVPTSDIPGEQAWPTQPFVLKPAPYARQQFSREDLSNFSKGSHDSLLKRFDAFRYEGLFTPPSIQGTFMLPGSRGGSSWGGAAVDPGKGIIYVRSNNSPEIATLKLLEEQETSNESLYNQGKVVYNNYCTNCHAADRNGDEHGTPSLVGIHNRLKREDIIKKIKTGGGKMPAFASIIAGKEDAILSYLTEKEPSKTSRELNFIKEIQSNESSNNAAPKAAKEVKYLNLTAYGYFSDASRRPGIKPPWGTLNAINLNTGEYEWTVTLGNQPDLQEKGGSITGTEGSAGPLVTAGGLVIIGGNRDKKLRAFDQQNGKLLWEVSLPGVANANPSTYHSNGKQYVAISVGGDKANPSGYVMAFALPNKK